METIVNISSLQPFLTAINKILEREGCRGNFAICNPNGVNCPLVSIAPMNHNSYNEDKNVCKGGLSMNGNLLNSSVTSRDFSSKGCLTNSFFGSQVLSVSTYLL